MKSYRIVWFCFLFCLVTTTPGWAWQHIIWNDTLDTAQVDLYQVAGPVKTLTIAAQQQGQYDSGGYIVNRFMVRIPSKNLSLDLRPGWNSECRIRLMLQPVLRKSPDKLYDPAYGVTNGNDQWQLQGFSLFAILMPPTPPEQIQSRYGIYGFGNFPGNPNPPRKR